MLNKLEKLYSKMDSQDEKLLFESLFIAAIGVVFLVVAAIDWLNKVTDVGFVMIGLSLLFWGLLGIVMIFLHIKSESAK